MRIDEGLYKKFLEQMQELERFRITYTSAHSTVPLDREDPDVRRMIEAMAFFSARTHRAGMRNIIDSHLRIFQQCFPYLPLALPAMGIFKAGITGKFAETVILPKGTELAVASPQGRSAIFLTRRDLKILPLTIREVQTLFLPGKGRRIIIDMQTPYARSDEIGTLSIHINHLNNFKASLLVFHSLKHSLKKASVVFNEKVTETSRGTTCEATFASPADTEEEEDRFHPILEERFFFQMPQQDLYMNVKIPTPPRNWERITICLDLDESWPKNMVLNRDVFHLFTVPGINLSKAPAKPLICDGTREEYPILHPDAGLDYVLHSLRGVYVVEEEGSVPLRPGIISGGNRSYELLRRFLPEQKKHQFYLLINFPEAISSPKTLMVDGLWFQPQFSNVIGEKLNVFPYSRNVPGIEWEIAGNIFAHSNNNFGDNMDNFMNLFTLKNKPDLNIDDVHSLLLALGNVFTSEFKGVTDLLTGLRVVNRPPKRKDNEMQMIRRIYYFRFSNLDPSFNPLVELFLKHMERVLDAWLPEALIEVRLDT